MRRLLLVVPLLALLLPSLPRAASAQSTAPQEITVNILQGEPDQIDPQRSSFNVDAAVVRQVFEPLLRFGPDLTPQPAAAASYDISPDGKTYTFHLRPDGKYSDGQPVRAQDFEYAWKRILDPNLGAEYASFFVQAGIVGAADYNAGKASDASGVGVRALDDQTFEVDLNAPFGPLPDLAALWVAAPVRQDIVSANPDSWTQDPSTYVGNGPFKMTEWVHQDHITFAQNPDWHGPAPSLTKMTFLMGTDETTDYAAYVNDERDWALVPDAQVQAAQNDPNLKPQVRSYNELTEFWLALNTSAPPLNNSSVRRALSMAIDRKALIRDIAGGVGLPATSIIPPGMPGFVDGLGSNYDYNPDAARQLLSQAGYPNGQGFPTLTFNFATTGANQRRAEFVQAQLKQNLRIDLNLNSQEAKVEQESFKAKTYQMSYHGWGADYPDPQDWFATLFGCSGGNNKFNYCNPAVDQLVSQADSGINLDDRLQIYNQAQRQIVDDMPVVPLLVRGRMVVVKPYVQNLTITAQDDFPGDLFLDQVSVASH
ncbi:MAG: peptide ABC transporter substrate-binding protein [Chloroflexi bacterium]|nr:peptide ABC transporter substrate-binding protein [Chloroflexota bacterium]